MITLSHTIEIKVSAKRVFDFFLNLKDNYQAWHPDHGGSSYLTAGPLGEGSMVSVDEKLHGKPHKLIIKVTGVKRNARIEYTTVLGIRGVFAMKARNQRTTIFTAELHFGSKIRVLSNLVDIALMSFFSHQLHSIKEHMTEEGTNLKRILETVNEGKDQKKSPGKLRRNSKKR